MNHVVTNLGHSARERLKNLSRESGRIPDYLFQRYAYERFFYRLGESRYRSRFVLKGASLFSIWLGPMFRVTQDVDFESSLTPDHELMADVFREIAELRVPDDGVRFDASSIEVSGIKAEDQYKGVRVKFNAFIEQVRIRLQFDVGFGDSVYPRPEYGTYPVLLGGGSPRIKIYPQYTVIAEKLSAMIGLGMENSRLKDYFDLWILSENFEFDGVLLKTAIKRTFKRKGLEIVDKWPVGLQDVFANDTLKIAQWDSFVRRTEPRQKPPGLSEVVSCIRTFLEPILFGGEAALQWSCSERAWGNGTEIIKPIPDR